MVAVRSLPKEGSSAAQIPAAAASAAARTRDTSVADFMVGSCRADLEIVESVAVTENRPDRLARGRDGARQARIVVLQQRHYFHEQLLVRAPQAREREPSLAGVEGAKLREQIVHLVLERQLGENADRVRIAQPLLERGEVECRRSWRWGGGCRSGRGGRCAGRCRV